jgi:hypothetical protein
MCGSLIVCVKHLRIYFVLHTVVYTTRQEWKMGSSNNNGKGWLVLGDPSRAPIFGIREGGIKSMKMRPEAGSGVGS